MNQLEADYPSVKFVYLTGHLVGSGTNGNLNQRNEQIRNYCRPNNKMLYDFADIESYDPDGTVNDMALLCNDNCDYGSDGNGTLDKNWAEEWLLRNPGSELAQLVQDCDSCAHSQRLNGILKGRAFWWLLARLAGWDGNVEGGNKDILWRYYGSGGYNVVWHMDGIILTGTEWLPTEPDINWRIENY